MMSTRTMTEMTAASDRATQTCHTHTSPQAYLPHPVLRVHTCEDSGLLYHSLQVAIIHTVHVRALKRREYTQIEGKGRDAIRCWT